VEDLFRNHLDRRIRFGPYNLAIRAKSQTDLAGNEDICLKKIPISVALIAQRWALARCQCGQIKKYFVASNRVSTRNCT
jgi:hypothetical protein